MGNDQRLRETILRFYATMQQKSFDQLVEEYHGKTMGDDFLPFSNRLYMSVEQAVAWYKEGETPTHNKKVIDREGL